MAQTFADLVTAMQQADIADPYREARYLLRAYARHFLGCLDGALPPEILTPRLQDALPASDNWQKMVQRRCCHEPLSYLTGVREFYGRNFKVSPAVLIPRPHSETLIAALADIALPRGADSLMLEVGTGSGCLAVVACQQGLVKQVIAGDISAGARSIAQDNVEHYQLQNRIRVIPFDAHSFHDWQLAGSCDIVLSNPPYIRDSDLAMLPRTVRQYEPLLALDGGKDGLDVVRAVMVGATRVVKPGGWLLLELGHDQTESTCREFAGVSHWLAPKIWQDFEGIPRVVGWQRAQS